MKKVYRLTPFIFAGALTILACNSKDENENLDHVILAINDLEKGINQFKNLTGVEPVFGGIHPNSFTQNAIISLGNKTYIEILAPRTDLDSIPDWIVDLDNLTPIGWAVATNDIGLTKEKLKLLNLITSEPEPGSRKTPRADILRWTTFWIEADNNLAFPFFINWNDNSSHPSENASTGCTLKSLKIVANDGDKLKNLSKKLSIHFDVIESSKEKIIVVINSPNGHVTFE